MRRQNESVRFLSYCQPVSILPIRGVLKRQKPFSFRAPCDPRYEPHLCTPSFSLSYAVCVIANHRRMYTVQHGQRPLLIPESDTQSCRGALANGGVQVDSSRHVHTFFHVIHQREQASFPSHTLKLGTTSPLLPVRKSFQQPLASCENNKM